MSLNVTLLRNSFEMVIAREQKLTARFYDILFQRHPEAQAMFGRRPRGAQEEMLASALVAVLDHLEDAPWLTATLAGLGEKHRGYGVRDEMYGWVGGALLAALAEIAAGDWTSELEAQWSEAYGIIATLMKSGAQAAA